MKFKNKLLIVGDVHTYYNKAEQIVEKFKDTHKIIFVGDYFDQFNDTVQQNKETAEWLKSILSNPNIITLRGNHDEAYDPRVNCYCSGHTEEKEAAINSVLSLNDWDKLKYFHYENSWLISHAGINKNWFFNPIKNYFHLNLMEQKINDAIELQRSGNYNNCIWAADEARGGKSKHGGILWQDWSKLSLIEDFKQVVGHTPIQRIQRITDNVVNAHIINVDASRDNPLSEVLEIDQNGYTEVLKIYE